MHAQLTDVFDHVLKGDAPGAQEAVACALEAGLKAETILHEGLIPAMDEVGRRYEEGDYFVPEMLIAARAMKAALADLKPLLVASATRPVARVAIGTVRGDLHDIGKNLVAMMLEGAGFEIDDLGTDVAPEQFVAAVEKGGAEIVGLSALLTTTMPMIASTIQALEAAGVREKVKVIIGGAPITSAYAEQVGADGYAADASQATTMARRLVVARE